MSTPSIPSDKVVCKMYCNKLVYSQKFPQNNIAGKD